MKRSTAAVALVAMLMSGTALAESNYDYENNEIEVGKGKKYQSIQAAVNSAEWGDTVLVLPGTYENYTPREGVTVKPLAEGTVTIAPKGSLYGGGEWGGYGGGSAIEKKIGGVGDNISNTDEQIINEILQGEAGAWNKLEDVLSGKVVTNEVNKAINKGTNAVTGAIDETIDTATDAVIDPIEETVDSYVDSAVAAVQCNFGGAAASAAAGAVTSIWGGGDATYGAQLAQWLTQVSNNWCVGEHIGVSKTQLKVEKRQRDLMKRMNAHGNADATDGINGMMERTMPSLAQAGFLSSEDAIQSQIGDDYPYVFTSMPPDDLIALDASMREHERQAHSKSVAIQNRAVQEQAAGLGRALDHAAAGRAGPGLRSELQAANAIAGEQIAAINSLTGATIANHRAMTEVELRKESMREASNRAAQDFMMNLGECQSCGTRSINIFGSGSAMVASGNSANSVFGTGASGN